MWCSHRGAGHGGVAFATDREGAEVHRGQNVVPGSAVGTAARSGNIDQTAVVGEPATVTAVVISSNRDDIGTVSRAGIGDILIVVTGSNNHHSTLGYDLVDGVLIGRTTSTTATQTHVDDIGRVGVDRYPGNA